MEASTQSLVAFSKNLLSAGQTAVEGTLAIERKASELLFLPYTNPGNPNLAVTWHSIKEASIELQGTCPSLGTCITSYLDRTVLNFSINANHVSNGFVVAPNNTSIDITSQIYVSSIDNYSYNLQFIYN